jgi:hypothetical protein
MLNQGWFQHDLVGGGGGGGWGGGGGGGGGGVLCQFWCQVREEIVQRGNRHLDNLIFCVTRSTQVPRATQNLPACAVAEIS